MRYFKYKNIKENEKNAEKEQYKALTKDEKRIFKKQKAWKNFSTVASWASFLLFACVGAYVIGLLHSPDFLHEYPRSSKRHRSNFFRGPEPVT